MTCYICLPLPLLFLVVTKVSLIRIVNTKMQSSLCSNEVRAKFFSTGGYYSPHIFPVWKANRASNKQKWLHRVVYYFYSVSSYYVNYETLLRYRCENIFETVESWHKALASFDHKIQLNLCNKKNFKFFLSSSELKKEACTLVLSYFYLVSKNIRDRQKTCIDERITASNIPFTIERLQNLFMESTAVRYYVVRNLLRSGERFIGGIDTVAFLGFKTELLRYQDKKLADTNHQRLNKSIEVMLTEEIQRCIKRQVDLQNFRLGMKLFQSCNLKTYRKNYKGDVVKKTWVLKNRGIDKCFKFIVTLRDRLLQMIVDAAVHPIIEYQSDSHSFAQRPNKSTVGAVALIMDRLKYLRKQKVSSKHFKFQMKKVHGRSMPSHFIIKADIHNCFDSIDHDMILKKYPLCSKYRYFLKAWLKAPIYGLFFKKSPNLTK